MAEIADLFEPLALRNGAVFPNRFVLAPLTNTQSHADGTLSEEEFRWLTMRAEGGFGTVMTCAAHVQEIGQGFAGQLGIWSDSHVPGLTRLARAIGDACAVSLVQLHHAGNRASKDLLGAAQPVCPSDDEASGARALTVAEIEEVAADFVRGAARAMEAGFGGVELHGAHGYLIGEFLSPTINRRTDAYGGSLEARAKLLFDILRGVRAECGTDFIVGVRLSPERFGMLLGEARSLVEELCASGLVEFVDVSLWDCAKEPEEAEFKGRRLIDWFTELDRRDVRLGVAGKLTDPVDLLAVLDAGADFALVGRAAILHHDYPHRLAADPGFLATRLPVTTAYLSAEGVSARFVDYLGNWPGFVVDPA